MAEANATTSLHDPTSDLYNLTSVVQDLSIKVSILDSSISLLQLQVSDISTKTSTPSVSIDLEVLQRLEALESSNTSIVEAHSTIMDILLQIYSSLRLSVDAIKRGGGQMQDMVLQKV